MAFGKSLLHPKTPRGGHPGRVRRVLEPQGPSRDRKLSGKQRVKARREENRLSRESKSA